jgi:hypothetical protein
VRDNSGADEPGQPARDLGIDLEVRILARVAHDRVHIFPQLVDRVALPQAEHSIPVRTGIELQDARALRGAVAVQQVLTARDRGRRVRDAGVAGRST